MSEPQSLDSLIATLNNLDVGALDKIAERLSEVREELERRALTELVAKIDDCRAALGRGELEEFRRLRATVVSRLGHVRLKVD